MRKEPLSAAEVRRLQRRWGLFTLACLAVAFLAVAVSQAQGYYTLATILCVVAGLAGAAYCTWQGIKKASRFRL